MASYDADLQAAVDATSVEKDSGFDGDLVQLLRDQLVQREIETADQEWLERTAQAIRDDPDYLVADQPSDYTPRQD